MYRRQHLARHLPLLLCSPYHRSAAVWLHCDASDVKDGVSSGERPMQRKRRSLLWLDERPHHHRFRLGDLGGRVAMGGDTGPPPSLRDLPRTGRDRAAPPCLYSASCTIIRQLTSSLGLPLVAFSAECRAEAIDAALRAGRTISSPCR